MNVDNGLDDFFCTTCSNRQGGGIRLIGREDRSCPECIIL